MLLILSKTVYSVLTLLQYISFLATCFGFYKTVFRPMLAVLFCSCVCVCVCVCVYIYI